MRALHAQRAPQANVDDAGDPFDLARFVAAQQGSYAQALAELRAGRKRSHWIWYVLPQLRGLGMSAMSERYGITGLAEARAYLAHPVLGPRLHECVAAMCAHARSSAHGMLGAVDAMKCRSCLTLFAQAAGTGSVFDAALERFYAGEPCAETLSRLRAPT
ncbi:MAG: DUF1810 domain-containing protein [Burkholderiaceae bacterium]